MSKKMSAEARIIEWFESAPMATAEIVLGIIRSRMKTRSQASKVDQAPAKPVVRRKRRTKAEMAAGVDPHPMKAGDIAAELEKKIPKRYLEGTKGKATSFDPADLNIPAGAQ